MMKHSKALVLLAFFIILVGCRETLRDSPEPVNTASGGGNFGPPQGEPIEAVLTSPPHVPPPIDRDYPAKVVVRLEVQEVKKEIAEGVTYTFWTYGGTVPGKFIRVRQGDTVEFHLMNHPDSKMPHSIDLHAVTGPGGGATSSFTAPGHESVFTFKALKSGLYLYHCASAPVGMHVANGMYGLILVEPPGGLPPVDREYYVVQGDFYTVGKYRESGLQPFDIQKAINENATYVLFNGSENALTGDNALQANVGESVRFYVGNGGPNLTSSFHLIGEIFNRVYFNGGTGYRTNVQTTLIPPGSAKMVEFTTQVPGSYVLVDHALFRAFNKGALGILKVEGPPNLAVYSGKQSDTTYQSETVIQQMAADNPPAKTPSPAGDISLAMRMTAGGDLYSGLCAVCHQPDGKGVPGVFPPLAGSDFLLADKQRAVGIVLNGLRGPVTVNGEDYNAVMPPLGQLTDEEVANILTFVMNSWGNSNGMVTPELVARVRAETTRTRLAEAN